MLNLLRFGEWADYSGFPEVPRVGASCKRGSRRQLSDREDQSRLAVVHFRRDKARSSWIGQLRLVSFLAARLRPSMRAPVTVWGWWDDPGAKVT